MDVMTPRERLEHMAEMYDSYGYGAGVMLGGRRRASSKSARRGGVSVGGARKLTKSGKPMSAYNEFFAHYRQRGLSPQQIGKLWGKCKKTGNVKVRTPSGKLVTRKANCKNKGPQINKPRKKYLSSKQKCYAKIAKLPKKYSKKQALQIYDEFGCDPDEYEMMKRMRINMR
jgi:hypothetical protein